MASTKHVTTHKKNAITKFQIIILLLFLIFDIFILKPIPISLPDIKGFVLIYFYAAQIVVSIICMTQNYAGLCIRLRKLKTDDGNFKPLFPMYLYYYFNNTITWLGFVLLFILVILIGNVALPETEIYAVDNAFVVVTVVVEALLMIIINNFNKKAIESQPLEVRKFCEMDAVERDSFLKRSLQVLFLVDVGICVCSIVKGQEFSRLKSITCFIHVFIATVSSYYTILNMKACLRQKKESSLLGSLLYHMMQTVLSSVVLYIWMFFCWFPTYIYFGVSVVLIIYTLLLNRYGKYPFIDYELQFPDLREEARNEC